MSCLTIYDILNIPQIILFSADEFLITLTETSDFEIWVQDNSGIYEHIKTLDGDEYLTTKNISTDQIKHLVWIAKDIFAKIQTGEIEL